MSRTTLGMAMARGLLLAASAASLVPIPPREERRNKGRYTETQEGREFRQKVREQQRVRTEAEIPDKYLHSAERRRRQAAREAAPPLSSETPNAG